MRGTVLPTRVAEFDGSCGLCDDVIHEGEDIVLVDDEWCHAECAQMNGYAISMPY